MVLTGGDAGAMPAHPPFVCSCIVLIGWARFAAPDSEADPMPDHDGEQLRPATREELVDSLSFAIRYQGRKRVRDADADSFMGRAAAERLVEHMLQSRFVVMKRPPAPMHSDAAHRRGPPLKD